MPQNSLQDEAEPGTLPGTTPCLAFVILLPRLRSSFLNTVFAHESSAQNLLLGTCLKYPHLGSLKNERGAMEETHGPWISRRKEKKENHVSYPILATFSSPSTPLLERKNVINFQFTFL